MSSVSKGDKKIESVPSTKRKALRINLNDNIYGTFSEIGAGQETARNFFRAGGASGKHALEHALLRGLPAQCPHEQRRSRRRPDAAAVPGAGRVRCDADAGRGRDSRRCRDVLFDAREPCPRSLL